MPKLTPLVKRRSTKSTKKVHSNTADAQALTLILNNADEGIMLLNDQLTVIRINPWLQKWYQDFFKILISEGDSLHSFFLSQKGTMTDNCKHALTGVPADQDVTVIHPYEGAKHFRASCKPARSDDHKITGVLVNVKDVVLEPRQILVDREMHLTSMINSAFGNKSDLKTCLNELITVWCRYFNQRACEVLVTDSDSKSIRPVALQVDGEPLTVINYSKPFGLDEGLPGKSWLTAQPVFIKDIQKDSIYVRKDFAKANQLTSATALPLTHKNKTVGVIIFYSKMESSIPVFVNKNVLDQLGGEIERKKSEDDLIRFFSYAPELLCIAGPDGFFKKVNPAFTQLLGYSEAELLNQPFANFIHPEDLINTDAKLRDIKAGQVIYSFENRYHTKSNEWRWISWTTSEVINEEGLVFCYGKDITEERKLRDLVKSTAKLARIGSWELDVINNKTYWSGETRKIFEVDDDIEPDLELGITFYKEGENRDRIISLVENAIHNGIKIDAELQLSTFKGNDRWVRIIGEPEFHHGKCMRLYGSIQDIHERKTTELEIQKVLTDRNSILESIGDGFFSVDGNWKVTYWNRQAELLSGIPKDQILGRNYWEVYHYLRNTPLHDRYQLALNSKEVQYFEWFDEITKIWYDFSAYPNEGGLSVYFKDVTERIHADETIRHSNQRFELLSKATNDAIWDFDIKAGTFTHIGDGFSKLFGYDHDEVTSDLNFLIKLVHPDDLQGMLKSRNASIQDHEQIYWEDEYRFKTKDDKYAYVHDRGYIIRDRQGNALRMIGATQDITHRKEYEKSLEMLNADLEKYSRDLAASNAELEQFAYVASHDLQEPLRMVSSFMTLLEKNYGDKIDDRGKQYIHFAVDGAKRMRQIILDLLEYSRVGRFNMQKEDVDVKKAIEEILLLYVNQINEKHATVVLENLPVIRSHHTPIRQIFQNLIGNALKYTHPDASPEIRIDCQESPQEYIFKVSDNGIGIAKEYYEKIFVLFQRLYTKNEYSGTGIGLSVCKKIVEALGGKIWVESEEGRGSTFYFTLPKA